MKRLTFMAIAGALLGIFSAGGSVYAAPGIVSSQGVVSLQVLTYHPGWHTPSWGNPMVTLRLSRKDHAVGAKTPIDISLFTPGGNTIALTRLNVGPNTTAQVSLAPVHLRITGSYWLIACRAHTPCAIGKPGATYQQVSMSMF